MTVQGTIEHWLRLGLGRAFLALRDDPSLAPPEMILEACLHNQALDRQLEGSRAEYMYAILELSRNDQPRWDYFRNALVEVLLAFDITSEYYDVQQVYLLVNRYADDGDQTAKQALYQHFDRFPHLAEYVGAQVLIALDGAAGFVHAVERIQDSITPDIDQYDRPYISRLLLGELEDHLGAETAHREFDLLRITNPKIGYFFRHAPEKQVHQTVPKEMAYSELQLKLRAGGYYPMTPSDWVKSATPADLEAAAEDLINRTTPPLFLLRAFRLVEFPREPRLLFSYFYDTEIPIRAAAFVALSRMSHPSIRTFALGCIQSDHQIGWSVGLLSKYIEPNDWLLLERLAQRDLEPEDYHSLAFWLLEIFDAHPTPDATAALFSLYEKVPSALSRRRVVKDLYALGTLPLWMKDECRHDSNKYIRQWVEEIGN